jgi:trehalose 6-phosphate phosphatase
MLRRHALAVFLDLDGDDVEDPRTAVLGEGMTEVLSELAHSCPVTLISSRDACELQAQVGLADIWYAGSHGFEVVGPRGAHHEHEAAVAALPALKEAAGKLRRRFAGVDGVEVQEKGFAIIVHHRPVDEGSVAEIVDEVHTVDEGHDQLRVSTENATTQLIPAVDWDKGKALRWLLRQIPQARDSLPIYAGNSQSDEAALGAVRTDGLGIAVRRPGDPDRDSAARVTVRGTAGLQELLWRLTA